MMIDIIDTCVNLFGIEIEPLGSTVDSKHICHHIELTWTCYPVTTILSLSHLMSSRSWVIRQGSSTPSLKRNKHLYQILTCKWRSCFSWPWLDDQSKKCDINHDIDPWSWCSKASGRSMISTSFGRKWSSRISKIASPSSWVCARHMHIIYSLTISD